jgi:hypothetical protein
VSEAASAPQPVHEGASAAGLTGELLAFAMARLCHVALVHPAATDGPSGNQCRRRKDEATTARSPGLALNGDYYGMQSNIFPTVNDQVAVRAFHKSNTCATRRKDEKVCEAGLATPVDAVARALQLDEGERLTLR